MNQRILITSYTPYFLEKGFSWFIENEKQILQSRKLQSFWLDNTLFLEKKETKLSETLRKLDEMGYEKVFKVDSQGEFSQKGGILEVFPINTKNAFRFDFLGNNIEEIITLPLEIKDEKKAISLLKKRLKRQKTFSDLKNVKTGNYLVHLDHGIGTLVDITKEYYILEYAQNDKLYVPINLKRKLSKYVGFTEPKISRLGSSIWQKTKRKIKQDAEKFAKELLRMFAERKTVTRPCYTEKELQESINSTFKYNLTPDQKTTLKDIEKDFQKETPIDRIICGDVGFGKTEIALRAAARVAENNKQVAMIAPTTILANQHYQNFQKRLKDLPFTVAMLSRLTKNKQKVSKGLKEGVIDIVIGTHSILSKKFKNLGLLIIDDEQKFGVKQKEALRTENPCLDVLSLSATPIPRTLYMALASLKDISLIKTPPIGRKSIKTFILPFNKDIIKRAIEKELKRKGQIYFLHNRVETINTFKQSLEDLKTKAKIGILHAKLREEEIIGVLDDFQKRKYDILLTTTIIENGLDIENANTLIVDNATRLGLAQSYQLRGRVGRSNTQSFAYFLYPKKSLKGKAKKRLQALKEAEELGSGYQIAQRDLEIRGTGNILGKEQSGSINRIGLNLYCQMLSQAIEKLK